MSETVVSIQNANIFQGNNLVLQNVNFTVHGANLFTWLVKPVREKAAC